ncbi:hypothetical protein PFICI_10272 [Pestalotiopsis fici W106-1]|uniref:Heterokaryon incompatibility domain-containing protein n=1 Tax=Pestalotiopsis fici (strain W106-1 / CGMCC3.15140) TaxID=1229662 RepID=W3WWI0_PESFW|nr:uncharacterized protein PFICI_10272 [Pestalotiopsis fici W106-1]ETS78210.1 hypothetical protein PFICI_10272 [Pestalotiopsis fici W106-1]
MARKIDMFRNIPMTDTRQQVRLLRIINDHDDPGPRELECELFVCTREYAPEYHVISHDGGHDTSLATTTVIINHRPVKITKCCEIVLRKTLKHSLYVGQEVNYWMDELCINRQDESETRHQVARLAHVYRDAGRVLQVRAHLDPKVPSLSQLLDIEKLLDTLALRSWICASDRLEDLVSELLESVRDRPLTYHEGQMAQLPQAIEAIRKRKEAYYTRVWGPQGASSHQRLSEHCGLNRVPVARPDIRPRSSHPPRAHERSSLRASGLRGPASHACNSSGHDTRAWSELPPVVSACDTQSAHVRNDSPPRPQLRVQEHLDTTVGGLHSVRRQDDGLGSRSSSSESRDDDIYFDHPKSRWKIALELMQFPQPEINNADSWYARCGLQLAARVARTLQITADADAARNACKARSIDPTPSREAAPPSRLLKDRQWAGIRITEGVHRLCQATESDHGSTTDPKWPPQIPAVDIRDMNTLYLDEAKHLPFAHLPSKAEYGDWVVWSTGGRELEALQDVILLLRPRPSEGSSPKRFYDIIGQGRKVPRHNGYFGVSFLRAHFQLNFHPEDALALAVQLISEYNSTHHMHITNLLRQLTTRVCGYERSSYAERESDDLLCSVA